MNEIKLELVSRAPGSAEVYPKVLKECCEKTLLPLLL